MNTRPIVSYRTLSQAGRMASGDPKPVRELIETGLEPEFLIDTITSPEMVGTLLRISLTHIRRNHDLVQCTLVASPADWAKIGRMILQMASEHHNLLLWMGSGGSH